MKSRKLREFNLCVPNPTYFGAKDIMLAPTVYKLSDFYHSIMALQHMFLILKLFAMSGES